MRDPNPSGVFPKVAKPGLFFLPAAAGLGFILALAGFWVPAVAAWAAAGFIGFFFRDPERPIPQGRGLVVSPADGRVLSVGTGRFPGYYEGEALRVSIFMSVFNVHVNRTPREGTVREIRHRPGRFHVASLEKAVRENEQNAISLDDAEGRRICVVQVAGLVARRIICYLRPGEGVRRGQRLGIICFGSRVDLYLPPETAARVQPGARVRAGATVLAEMGAPAGGKGA